MEHVFTPEEADTFRNIFGSIVESEMDLHRCKQVWLNFPSQDFELVVMV